MSSIPPNKLAIYYSWPIAINGTWSVSAAVADFDDYDMVVFGAGLEESTHPEYSSTNQIINDTTANIYGYIDSTLNQSSFEAKVDKWAAMGGTGNTVVGIFCDQFGFDFGMNRAKQNDEIDYIHNKGLKAFVNAWNPDDVFKNITGASATKMNSDDWYLAESFQIINGNYQNVSDWKSKADKMKDYKDNGPGYSNMAIVTTNSSTGGFNQDKWDYAYYSATLYGFDAAGWGEYNFSASDAVMPFRTRKEVLGTNLVGTISEDNGVFEISTNIGIKVDTNNKTVTNLL